MTTSYFTFGQAHAHSINVRGVQTTFDKDTVVKITSADPRAVMVETFGLKWAHEYNSEEKVGLHWFPKGVIELL